MLLSEILKVALLSFLPLYISFVINSQDYFLILAGLMVAIFSQVLSWLSYYAEILYNAECKYSIYYQAFRYLLCLDPICHTSQNSGEIISVVERVYNAYDDLIEVFVYDILSIITSLITVIFSLFYFNFWLGLFSLVSVIILCALSYFLSTGFANAAEFVTQIRENQLKSHAIESLSQIPYIRACFATNQQVDILKNHSLKMISTESSNRFGYSTINQIVQLIYRLFIFSLSALVIYLTQMNVINSVTAVALVLTYIAGSRDVLWRVGAGIRRLLEAYNKVVQSFEYLRNVGIQTFPVLE